MFVVVHTATLHLATAGLNPEFHSVRLSLREKQSFYEHLSQFVRGGVPLPMAVEKLASTSSGSLRGVFLKLRDGLAGGLSVPDAFAALAPALGETERAAIAALGRSGRMESGLQELSNYFGALAKAREEILQRSLWPLFSLNFGFLALNIPKLLGEGGTHAYLKSTAFLFFVFYGLLAIVALSIPLLRDAGSHNATLDWILRRVPLIGKVRRSLSLARFCATYDMQLEAGVNVIDSLIAAGHASQSGLIESAMARTVPRVREGAQVGPLLAESRAFPESFVRTFLVAEETGELDRALGRLAIQYQADGLGRLERLSHLIPRIVSLSVMIYLGWEIVSMYKGYLDGIMRQFGSD